MDLKLKDKVAIVTGTGSQIGFGHAIALTLAKEGCHVAGFDLDGEGAEKTAAEIKKLGRKATATKVDISNKEAVNAAVAAVVKEFGTIDILVNDAGRSVPWSESIGYEVEDYMKTMKVNFFGSFNMVKAVAPVMIEKKHGRIVNFSGGQNYPNDSAYGASKGAVDSWTMALAKELLPKGIYVNLFLPPAAETNLGTAHLPKGFWDKVKVNFPLKRLCTTQEVADVVTFMCSDINSYMNSQLIKLDVQ
jgi:NAD(P)-dependent dehydrogenase (short-subunit alcohol dehydrogenase family)